MPSIAANAAALATGPEDLEVMKWSVVERAAEQLSNDPNVIVEFLGQALARATSDQQARVFALFDAEGHNAAIGYLGELFRNQIDDN